MQTTLVFVGIPLAIFAVVALVTLRSKFVSSPRYRPGQEWDYPPVWWSANPKGVGDAHARSGSRPASEAQGTAVRGGARGNW